MAIEPLRFERFDKSRHHREAFDCGTPSLTEYLKTKLNQQMKRGVTVGYVLVTPEGRIAGYVTLSNGEIPVGFAPTGLHLPPQLPVPTTVIGRLAVDRAFQGRGLGGDLLVHAIRKAVEVSQHVASAVVEVDAVDENARRFYEHYGFRRLPDDELHLYLPMADTVKVAGRSSGRGE